MLTAGTPAGAPKLLLSEFWHPVAWVRETCRTEDHWLVKLAIRISGWFSR